ncbi:MAG: PEP-utilizing enzyme [Deltaproteobacteria bacterium]|nr:PEP-utilizing enzyme [Deltaproteobacteria bacterium]
MTKWMMDWKQAAEGTREQCGGKGWNLAQLHNYGFHLPKGGVIITDLYEEIINTGKIKNFIALIKDRPDNEFTSPKHALLIELKDEFLKVKLPENFRVELEDFLARCGLTSEAIAVRSSGTLEDGSENSFAGIHDSFLNVIGLENVESAILKCYASLWSARAISYRRKMNISDDAISAALVIMGMVNAESAGVAFTCDPATGRRDVMVINANFGLGESVVSGVAEPDQYRLNRYHKKLIDRYIGNKEKTSLMKEGGGTALVPGKNSPVPSLTNSQVEQLARLCDRVFHLLGKGEAHQDIEWAFDGDQFVVLQSRPVTGMTEIIPAELKNQPLCWSNGNFRDAVPMVLPRLSSEFCDYHINDIMRKNFDCLNYPIDRAARFSCQFEGRLYCNSSLVQWLWYDTLGVEPEKTNISLGGHQYVIHIDKKCKRNIRKRLSRIWRMILFVKAMASYKKNAKKIIDREIAYTEKFREKDLSALSDKELMEALSGIDSRLDDYNSSFVMLSSASGALFMLVQTLEKYFHDKAYSLANALMAGISDITSANHGYELQVLASVASEDEEAKLFFGSNPFEPHLWQEALRESSPFRQAFKNYLREYGHRAIYEMDVTQPRWRETPDYLLKCISNYLSAGSLSKMEDKGKQASDEAWREIKEKVPRYMHRYIKNSLKQAAKGAALREMGKSTYARHMEILRYLLLEMANRLKKRNLIESENDIFHCARAEIIAVLKGEWHGRNLKEIVLERKEIKSKQEELPAPDILIDDKPKQVSHDLETAEKGLKGIGVAAGIAKGTARLIASPDEGHRLTPDDILVAPSTDPSWTPLFLNVSAIVMETGGYLSHGAIVAREYGIPAVVNVPGAMRLIKEGEKVEINGGLGLVRKIKC